MSDVATLYDSLNAAVSTHNFAEATNILSKLKLALLSNNALVPNATTRPEALAVARDILETGAVVSIYVKDEAAFLRYYAQLQAFYSTSLLASIHSKNKNKIAGLYLLFLLTKNSIAEFHTTLENLPNAETDPFLKYPVMLERWLMEGSYDKVWQATKGSQVPSPEYALFSDVGCRAHFRYGSCADGRRCWSRPSGARLRAVRRRRTPRCRFRTQSSCFS